jgi:hypothetical protein
MNTTQKHKLLSMMGYRGPASDPEMEAFIQSSPAISSKMGKFTRAAERMQPQTFNEGGAVGQTEGGDVAEAAQPNLIDVYKKNLGRMPDPEGLDYWKNQVNSGRISYEEAVRNISNSEEAQKYKSTGEVQYKGETLPDPEETRANVKSTAELAVTAVEDPMSLVKQGTPTTMEVTEGQLIDPSLASAPAFTPAVASTVKGAKSAAAVEKVDAATMTAETVTPDVEDSLNQLEAAQGVVSEEAQVAAEQQDTTAVSDLQAAQGEAILMDNPVQREIQNGELISGSAVDAVKVEQLNAQLQAAQATPSDKATVQGQLQILMQQFESGNPPAWAAGAMRNAQGILAQRGLGASSMAGQAVVQAAMESALPIAQADAATRASFEAQNLSNRQQVAMFAAQQRAAFLQQEFDQEFQTRVLNASRVADIANMNFTAEQQIALENSRAANTMNLANLSNRQAMILAEASALSNLEMANLNNRQQAAVETARNFLQMDMANLSNQQQTALFKAQQRVTALFSDQAAINASQQFNAASENQTNQFFADLQSTVSRFNADQANAIKQFNAKEKNATAMFNASLAEQRYQFETSNALIIEQANSKWRQDISTMNTAAENQFTMEAVKTANNLTTTAIDNIWQRERDLMNFAFASAEGEKDRNLSVLLADKELEMQREKMDNENDQMFGAGLFQIAKDFFS